MFRDCVDRAAKRELFQLISASGATNDLRQLVYANPDLVGESVRLTVFRRDTLREIPVKLGAPQPDAYKIEKIKKEAPKPATGSAAAGP